MQYQYNLYVILCLIFSLLFGSQAYSAEEYSMGKNKLGEAFEITPNLWVELDDGLKIQFLAHSHKMQAVGGPESPLIVRMRYELSGIQSEEYHYLYPDKNGSLSWTWSNYTIHVMQYIYEERMTLNINKDQ